MLYGKFMARYGIKRYNFLPTGDKKIVADDTYEIKVKEVSESKLPNKIVYNYMILAQE